MIRRSELDMEWHSPQALADRADDGFRYVVRSAAWIVCSLPSGMGYGLSKLGRVVLCKKPKRAKRSTEPAEAPDACLSAIVGAAQDESPCRDAAKADGSAPCTCPVTPITRATVKRTPVKLFRVKKATAGESPSSKAGSSKAGECSPVTMESLLKEHAPKDKVKAIILRKALDDLLKGSEAAQKSALETLVDLGPVSGPLLVACTREDSAEVVELAFEGLRHLNWHCLPTSISAVLDSPDADLRIIALRAAGRLTDDRRRALLERGLRDPISRVRRRAISYVSWHGSSWAISEIMRLCDDNEADVKWAAAEALMALDPSKACEHLKLMMPSLSPTYRRRAAALLAQQEKSKSNKAAAKVKPKQQEASAPNVAKEKEEDPVVATKGDTREHADIQDSPRKKRRRKESKKRSRDAESDTQREKPIDEPPVAQTPEKPEKPETSVPDVPKEAAPVVAETNDTRE